MASPGSAYFSPDTSGRTRNPVLVKISWSSDGTRSFRLVNLGVPPHVQHIWEIFLPGIPLFHKVFTRPAIPQFIRFSGHSA